MKPLEKMIPLDRCKDGVVYEIRSRNLVVGVFVKDTGGFIGIREKFGSLYLFMEYHHDTGAPFGTVRPLKKLGMAPKDLPLSAHLETVDKATMRCVEFDRPVADGGKGWFFLDTGIASDRIHAVSLPNKKLFNFLASIEKAVMAKCKKCRHPFTPSWLDKNGRCPACEIRIKHER